MVQADGFHDVPKGKVATVVTHLEMRAKPELRPGPDLPGITLDRVRDPDPEWYRDLFRRVGGLDWLWFSRLTLSDAELTAILGDPGVHVIVPRQEGRDIGLLELDFRQPGACELAFFGLVPEAIGTGCGRFLMNVALTRAWEQPIARLHVHTCTLDHPAALGFYIRSGFSPLYQQIEVADDPRLTGELPETAAPHIPIFRP